MGVVPANTTIQPGELLSGKYRIERLLGRGGMGEVYAGEHTALERPVAIKILREDCATAVGVERFRREARMVAALDSEHLCEVFDIAELASGQLYIVMELLEGEAFDELSSASLSREEIVDYILEACTVLALAHAEGIVHRDLKPANLFLARKADGSRLVKLLDFGVAKFVERKDEKSLTDTDAVVGSPLFMSPEQLRASSNIDRRSDIWSLGAVMYQLNADRPVFDADTVADLVVRILCDAPVPLTEFRPDIPAALAAAIMRCLEKKAPDRFDNVGALALAIAPFGSDAAAATCRKVVRVAERHGWTLPDHDGERQADDEASAPTEAATGPVEAEQADTPRSVGESDEPDAAASEPRTVAVEPAGAASETLSSAVLPTNAPTSHRRLAVGGVAALLLVLVAFVVFQPNRPAATPAAAGSAPPLSSASPSTAGAETHRTETSATPQAAPSATPGQTPAAAGSATPPSTAAKRPSTMTPAPPGTSRWRAIPPSPHPPAPSAVAEPNCEGNNALIRDEHGGWKVKPGCR